jgi:hypothetical protein
VQFLSEPTKLARQRDGPFAFTHTIDNQPLINPTSQPIKHQTFNPSTTASSSLPVSQAAAETGPSAMVSRRPRRSSPSDEPPNGLSPANSTTSNESFYSLSPELVHKEGANGHSGIGKPWNRVDLSLQREFAREKKAGKLSFERKVELYGDKLEGKFRELEERLLCREEELLLKGRELQRTLSPSQRSGFFWVLVAYT